ncbi:MAG: hypothetical protein E7549_06710 [Ruminococcaceae bacterium]|nr:hypothetical protein [Oscillospiraceae bacterium]
MKKRQIVNIVNFLRGVEPRMERDLLTPLKEQIRLMQQHRLRGTFLLQYDALLDPAYTDLLRTLDPAQFEFGVWHEIVEPQAKACNIPWTGRFAWDWHCHCGFPVGYTKVQREQLVDVLFERFRTVFGYYPRVFGSWFFDSHTARYVCDRYEIDALCNCKEQFGTDGYTLWGGYYGQGYYPSRNNVFFPARREEHALPAPLFRMLGSDPVYQYDAGMDIRQRVTPSQKVFTLEPSYPDGGGADPRWVDWYMRENFNGECLSFGYAQAGQENSFGWDLMRDGILYQFPLFERLQNEGKITVEPLGETGRWYKNTFARTPASAIVAHTAYDDERKHSVWYSTDTYRINLYGDADGFRIRDLHLFGTEIPDPYENARCTENSATYETLPVFDGFRHSGNGTAAGGRLAFADGTPISCNAPSFQDHGEEAVLHYGAFSVTLRPRSLSVSSEKPFTLTYRYGKTDDHFPAVKRQDETVLTLSYNGTAYSLTAAEGRFVSPYCVRSENGRITLCF